MVGSCDNRAMERLNYHHLLCIWTIAEEGNLSQAATRFDLTHSMLGEQLKRTLAVARPYRDDGRHGASAPPG